MTNDEKLEQIIDRLLVKTQDNLCTWKKIDDDKFSLKTNAGTIHIYENMQCHITLDITDHNSELVIASITTLTLIKLFEAINASHDKYVGEHIDALMKELHKLGSF